MTRIWCNKMSRQQKLQLRNNQQLKLNKLRSKRHLQLRPLLRLKKLKLKLRKQQLK